MDPIGFGMENFDALGEWREKDGNYAIDPGGKLVSGEEFKGPAEHKNILLTKKNAEFVHCLSDKMLTYALGRGTTYLDKCALDQVGKGLARNNYKFSALITEIVSSVPFQMCRGEAQSLVSQ